MVPKPSPAFLVSIVALFVALGGTSAGLSGRNTVQSNDIGPGAQVKAPDIATDAVKGSSVADGSIRGADVADDSLDLSKFNGTSYPHRLEYSAIADDLTSTTIAEFGELRISASCLDIGADFARLFVRLDNLSAQTATVNSSSESQVAAAAPDPSITGGLVEARVAYRLDRSDASDSYLASGSFNRVEGQATRRIPGQVTTIVFHAFAGAHRCEFYATATSSNRA